MAMVANCDIALIVEALKTKGVRLDVRAPETFRKLSFEFAPDSSSCVINLGQTRVFASITADLGPPKQGRENQGTISVKIGCDANLLPEHGVLGGVKTQLVMLTRLLERLFFTGNALDREALCVVAGETVWHLHVDVRILDNDGNLTDACVLSVLGALSVHRRPEVTSSKSQEASNTILEQHSVHEREPLSLTLHHLPIPTSFALFENGDIWVVDPDYKESIAMTGCFTVVSDPQGNILNIHKIYGIPLSSSKILTCMKFALQNASQLSKVLHEALKEHEAKRINFRVIRSDDNTFTPETSTLNDTHTTVEKRQSIFF